MSSEKLRALKQQLEQARKSLDAERTQRALDDAASRERSRLAAQQRHEAMMAQLRSLGTTLQGQKVDQAEHADHDEEARRHRRETEATISEILGALSSVQNEQDAPVAEEQEFHGKPTLETLVQEIRRSSVEKAELLFSLSDQIQEDNSRRHEELRHILLANASARESVSYSEGS
ncbi:hypothetical protein BV25DRAFT_1915661 [Artomyces pyxidatus]|uniref:Uncharacterized protein n=1 Tax=Artomyces pyxidatus TaxID=48021 RepID=A0ACB8T328_9AGAM|nr:hypothetical protein BV25DRAFT_1915661 [Artomyces pyxidatus]